MDEAEQTTNKKPARPLRRLLLTALVVLLVVGVAAGTYGGYVYSVSPAVIRNPKLEHYHFRLQILVNGQPQNFADAKYQQGYAKDSCTADLPAQPVHFHDNKDQMVHIHWEGITGGLVMKNYGWNLIGGSDATLGYRLDKSLLPQKVPIHGADLPEIPADAQFYIYTGDENSYSTRSFDDWKTQDIEQFLGKTSNFPAHKTNQQSSLLDWFFPKAYAHDGEDHGVVQEAATGTAKSQEDLTRINNLLGNVVIFVQSTPPKDQQIKDRFQALEPLSESTCGG